MRRGAWAGLALIGAVGCQQAPEEVLTELPPPRLAVQVQAASLQRFDVAQTSSATLILGQRRNQVRLRLSEVRGWLSTDLHNHVAAGQLSFDLSSLEPDPGPNGGQTEATKLDQLTRAGQLELRWARRTAGAFDSDDAQPVHAELTLNGFRSEIQPSWRIRRDKQGRAVTAEWRKSVSLELADHGLTPRVRHSDGREDVVTSARLNLQLALSMADSADTADTRADERADSERNP